MQGVCHPDFNLRISYYSIDAGACQKLNLKEYGNLTMVAHHHACKGNTQLT